MKLQRDPAVGSNRLFSERIFTLERYMTSHEGARIPVELDSLRQRIAELDRQLAVERAEPSAAMEEPEEPVLIADSVHFASNSSLVGPDNQRDIEATARRIIALDVKRLLVTGHTDRSGDAGYNLALSQRRAEAVAQVLRTAGVPTDRIRVRGLGQELAQKSHDRNERVVLVQAVPAE